MYLLPEKSAPIDKTESKLSYLEILWRQRLVKICLRSQYKERLWRQ